MNPTTRSILRTGVSLSLALAVACTAADGDDTSGEASQSAGTDATTGGSGTTTAPATTDGSGSSDGADGSSSSDDGSSETSADTTSGDPVCDPQTVGTFTPADGNARGFDIGGDRLYLATESGGLVVLDVADPAAPAELGLLDFGSGNLAERVAVGGEGIVFVGMRGSGWAAVDVADPAQPTELYRDDSIEARDVAWADDVLYVANVNGVQVFDVADPTAPVGLVTDNVLPGSTQTVVVVGDYAYATGLAAGLSVLDVSDPAAAYEVSTTDHDGRGYVAVAGDRAYLSTQDGIAIFDVTDPQQPTEIGLYAGERLDAVAADTRLWVTGTDTTTTRVATLTVVDVVDPAMPVALASLDDYARPTWIEAVDGVAYYTEENDQALHVVVGCP